MDDQEKARIHVIRGQKAGSAPSSLQDSSPGGAWHELIPLVNSVFINADFISDGIRGELESADEDADLETLMLLDRSAPYRQMILDLLSAAFIQNRDPEEMRRFVEAFDGQDSVRLRITGEVFGEEDCGRRISAFADESLIASRPSLDFFEWWDLNAAAWFLHFCGVNASHGRKKLSEVFPSV